MPYPFNSFQLQTEIMNSYFKNSNFIFSSYPHQPRWIELTRKYLFIFHDNCQWKFNLIPKLQLSLLIKIAKRWQLCHCTELIWWYLSRETTHNRVDGMCVIFVYVFPLEIAIKWIAAEIAGMKQKKHGASSEKETGDMK